MEVVSNPPLEELLGVVSRQYYASGTAAAEKSGGSKKEVESKIQSAMGLLTCPLRRKSVLGL